MTQAVTQQRPAPLAEELATKSQQHGVSLKPLHKDFGVLVSLACVYSSQAPLPPYKLQYLDAV